MRRLEELPARAVDGERERALGELDARLVKHQTVGTRLVEDLEGFRVVKVGKVALSCVRVRAYLSILAFVVPVALNSVGEEAVLHRALLHVVHVARVLRRGHRCRRRRQEQQEALHGERGGYRICDDDDRTSQLPLKMERDAAAAVRKFQLEYRYPVQIKGTSIGAGKRSATHNKEYSLA